MEQLSFNAISQAAENATKPTNHAGFRIFMLSVIFGGFGQISSCLHPLTILKIRSAAGELNTPRG